MPIVKVSVQKVAIIKGHAICYFSVRQQIRLKLDRGMSCLLFFTMCGEKPNIKLMAVKKPFVLKAFMCCVLASLLVNKVLSSLLLRHHLNTAANFSKYRVGSGSIVEQVLCSFVT